MPSHVKTAYIIIAAFVLFALVAPVFGQDLGIANASIDKSNNVIYVNFTTPTPLTPCEVQVPQNASCSIQVAPWTVVVYDASSTATQLAVVLATVENATDLIASGLVTLKLAVSVPPTFSRIDITFGEKNRPYFSILPKAGDTKPKNSQLSAASGKTDADVYISGTFAPAEGSSPTYSIDAKAQYPTFYYGHNDDLSAFFQATVVTDNKKTADPDSYTWSINTQYAPAKPYNVQWAALGMLFDRSGNTIDVQSAPSITGDLSHNFYLTNRKTHASSPIALALDITLGIELGSTIQNDYGVSSKSVAGNGFYFRGAPTANFYFVIPQVMHLQQVTLTSSYTARIPTRDEVFVVTEGVDTPTPVLSSKTRSWLQAALQFNITKLMSFQIKYQMGELPPAFKFVDNSGSAGLVFSFKQSK